MENTLRRGESNFFVISGKTGRVIAYDCATDVVMRAGLDRDTDLKAAVSRFVGKPIRECQMDRKAGRSRVIRCFKCNGHFTPAEKIVEHRPYYDAGYRPHHVGCVEAKS
jgi:hypothetical protein